MATDLYHRTMDFDYGDGGRCELMQRVWRDTPWMVDTYTGGYSRNREREHAMLMWCYDAFGEQASPIHGKPGHWQRGSATVDGWTWYGFSTEAEMNAFTERWPTPPSIEHPDSHEQDESA